MKKMTTEQIEAKGKAMPRILTTVRELLIGATFKGLQRLPQDEEYCEKKIALFQAPGKPEVVVVPQWDDEGNPGEVDLGWTGKGKATVGKSVVTDVGYFIDYTPFVEMDNGLYFIPRGDSSRPSALRIIEINEDGSGREDMLCQLH
jgi:hypothetical protein